MRNVRTFGDLIDLHDGDVRASQPPPQPSPCSTQWSPVPQGRVEASHYIDTALSWLNAGSAVPFKDSSPSKYFIFAMLKRANFGDFPFQPPE